MGTVPSPTLTGSLLPGFVIIAVGLAAMSIGRARHPVTSTKAFARALGYALIYGFAGAAFARVIGTALVGEGRGPSLLALCDVIFVTMGLFVLVAGLLEGHEARDYGLKAVPPARLVVTLAMGLGAAVIYAFEPYLEVLTGRHTVDADTLVFAALAATLGSAIPEEILVRGYVMRTLEGRSRMWSRIAISAIVFAAIRGLRYAPSLGLGSPGWMFYLFGVVLPLGLWWGLMRELAGGSVWPSMASHVLLEFGASLTGDPPTLL